MLLAVVECLGQAWDPRQDSAVPAPLDSKSCKVPSLRAEMCVQVLQDPQWEITPHEVLK